MAVFAIMINLNYVYWIRMFQRILKNLFVILLFCIHPEFAFSQNSTLFPFEKEIDSLLHVAKSLIDKRDLDGGFTMTEVEIKKIVDTFGMEHWLLIRAYANIGNYHEYKIQYEESIRFRQKAIQLIEKLYQGKHPLYNRLMTVVGMSYMYLGDQTKAEQLIFQALENVKKIANPKPDELLFVSRQLAYFYINTLQYEKAERTFLDAINLSDKANTNQSIDLIEIERGLATVYFQTSRIELAIQLFERTRDKMVANKLNQTGSYAALLINMAGAILEQGDYDKALASFQEAKLIWENIAGKESSFYLICILNISVIYAKNGNCKEAIQYIEETAPALEKSAGKESREYFQLLLNWGSCFSDLGKYQDAQSKLLEATILADSLFGNLHDNYAIAAHNLYWNYNYLGFEKEAVQYMQCASNAITNTFAQAGTYLTEEELAAYKTSMDFIFEGIFRLADNYQTNNIVASIAFNNCLFLKGFLLNAVIKMKNTALRNPNTKIVFEQFQKANKILTTELSKPSKERIGVQDASAEVRKLEKEIVLQLGNQEFNTVQINYKDVQKKLANNAVVIEFIDYDENNSKLQHYYSAVILHSGNTPPKFVRLCTISELNALINLQTNRKSDYVNNLYTIPARGAIEIQEAKQSLYELIWKPIEVHLAGIESIYFSPSGLLHRINLDAIPINETETLADKYQLIEMSSTRQLVIPNQIELKNNDAILYGGIQYELDSNIIIQEPLIASRSRGELSFNAIDITLRGGTWNYLAGTEREADAIKKTMESAGLQIVLIKGTKATEESFKNIGTNNKPSPRILHIATHGYFFPDTKNNSQESQVNNQNENVFTISDHPMLRSGLIMAGGNAAWQGKQTLREREDGILTAYEISQMNLSNTELVVLSACETGLGDIQGNEGVYGLQRAFKIAGAKYLIMSLWQVPDKQTSLLMTTFYKKWLEAEGPDKGGNKMTIPNAFHAAQKELRDLGLDPYQWAGFVLVE